MNLSIAPTFGGEPDNSHASKDADNAGEQGPETGLFSNLGTRWLGDVDSNHGKQSQSLLSYR